MNKKVVPSKITLTMDHLTLEHLRDISTDETLWSIEMNSKQDQPDWTLIP